MTSHAAVVARGMGKCCVAGAPTSTSTRRPASFTVGGKTFTKDDWISSTAHRRGLCRPARPTMAPNSRSPDDFAKLMGWADKYRTLGVRTNADTPPTAKRARDFGAEGIGLCRTEHMFFEGDRSSSPCAR
jgi:pyruvate,orthophosphate dikinase